MTLNVALKCVFMECAVSSDRTNVRLSDPQGKISDVHLSLEPFDASSHFVVGGTYNLALYPLSVPTAPTAAVDATAPGTDVATPAVFTPAAASAG